ncbi:MAG: glycosyltransferase family 4 protein [Nodosilinea sp.]
MVVTHSNLQNNLENSLSLGSSSQAIKILIFADNASMNMSGEAALALYYFDRLRERNHDVWLVCHSRVQAELYSRYNKEIYSRIRFIKDSRLQKAIYRFSQRLPFQIRDSIIGQLLHLITQLKARPIIKQVIKEWGVNLVFAPSVISPKAASCLYDLGVPVVIGPMCGGIDFPPCFQNLESILTRLSTFLGRSAAYVLNRVFPGKPKAAALLVANPQTARALPQNCRGKIYEVVESGVDLSIWQPAKRPQRDANQPVRFVYMARFVDQKGIPFLIEAFNLVAQHTDATLDLIGHGELFESMKAKVREFNLQDRVVFHGWLALQDAAEVIQQCDVYLVPAIRDCGGCAMLEAMAMGLPVIAANWAGPGAILDDNSGIRVDVPTREAFVQGLTKAMVKLVDSSSLREQMGKGSLKRVQENYFDWDSKVDRIVEIFREVLLESKYSTAAIRNRLKSRY